MGCQQARLAEGKHEQPASSDSQAEASVMAWGGRQAWTTCVAGKLSGKHERPASSGSQAESSAMAWGGRRAGVRQVGRPKTSIQRARILYLHACLTFLGRDGFIIIRLKRFDRTSAVRPAEIFGRRTGAYHWP